MTVLRAGDDDETAVRLCTHLGDELETVNKVNHQASETSCDCSVRRKPILIFDGNKLIQ